MAFGPQLVSQFNGVVTWVQEIWVRGKTTALFGLTLPSPAYLGIPFQP